MSQHSYANDPQMYIMNESSSINGTEAKKLSVIFDVQCQVYISKTGCVHNSVFMNHVVTKKLIHAEWLQWFMKQILIYYSTLNIKLV